MDSKHRAEECNIFVHLFVNCSLTNVNDLKLLSVKSMHFLFLNKRLMAKKSESLSCAIKCPVYLGMLERKVPFLYWWLPARPNYESMGAAGSVPMNR